MSQMILYLQLFATDTVITRKQWNRKTRIYLTRPLSPFRLNFKMSVYTGSKSKANKWLRILLQNLHSSESVWVCNVKLSRSLFKKCMPRRLKTIFFWRIPGYYDDFWPDNSMEMHSSNHLYYQCIQACEHIHIRAGGYILQLVQDTLQTPDILLLLLEEISPGNQPGEPGRFQQV